MKACELRHDSAVLADYAYKEVVIYLGILSQLGFDESAVYHGDGALCHGFVHCEGARLVKEGHLAEDVSFYHAEEYDLVAFL